MKKIIGILVCTLISYGIGAQSIIGAWENGSTSEHGEPLKTTIIFTEGYYVSTTYKANTGEFINTNGGSWKLDQDKLTKTVEFNTEDSELVGKALTYKLRITKNTIEIADSKIQLKRIDNGKPGELQGAWLMSGRVKDGNTEARDTTRPRKTMKILSGTRFQWIAYNTETKQFMGTGGGTYTTVNGEYTEQIEFFSKDNSRVGMALKFNFKLEEGHWIHTGFSSKGDPIHEIWSQRK